MRPAAPAPATPYWLRNPMLLAALAVSAGIAFAALAYRPPIVWLAAAIAAFAVAAFAIRRATHAWPAHAAALVVFAATGGLLLAAHDARRPRLANVTAFAQNQPVEVSGTIVSSGRWRPVTARAGAQRNVVDIETWLIRDGDRTSRERVRVRTTVVDRADSDDPQTSAAPLQLEYGQHVRFTTRLREPRNFGNPGAFDYRGWLRTQGVTALAWTEAEKITLIAGPPPSGLRAWRTRTRNAFLATIGELWPEPQASLIAAMILGERGTLDRQLKSDFQRTGVYHVLVVSGMNVGMLAVVVFWLLRRLRLGEAPTTFIAFLLVMAYALLTDGGDPIVRATLMLGIYLLTRLLYREASSTNAVGFSALLILAWYPRALFEASFQLTFLAVLAITGIAVPLMERTSEPYRKGLRHLASTTYDLALPPKVAQFRVELRMLLDRLRRVFGYAASRVAVSGLLLAVFAVFELVLVSALMQFALVLPMAFYFHRVTVLGLLANIAVVPLTAILMPAALAAATIAPVMPVTAQFLSAIAGGALDVMIAIVERLGQSRFVDLRVAHPQWLPALFAAGSFAFAIWAAGRKRWISAASIALMVMAALALVYWPRTAAAPAGVTVTAIDVGQGDALLVTSPEGNTLLIDAGGLLPFSTSELDIGEHVVSSFLWARGIERLDAVALTHAHADHIGGIRAVLRNFRPRELWVGVNPHTAALREVLATAQELGMDVRTRTAGERFAFGGAQVEVLAPPAIWTPDNTRNDDSLALRIAFGETAVLLPGDIERKVERTLVAHLPRAQLLKVPHHGSNTSSTPEFLAAVRPEFAVISVGARNPYGHPTPQVLARLQAARIRTYRTDAFGAVTFLLDGKSVRPLNPAP